MQVRFQSDSVLQGLWSLVPGRMGWVVTLFGVLAVLSVFPSHTGAIVHAQKDAQEGGSGKLRTGIDWDKENKLPPWMSSITEGASQAIAVA